MTWLLFLFALELGYTPNMGVLQYKPFEYYDEPIFYTQLDCELLFFNHVFIGGGIRTYIVPSGSYFNYSPNTIVYDFKAGLRFKYFEAGINHRCFHPTFPYLPFYQQRITGLEGAYDEVYIRITNKR